MYRNVLTADANTVTCKPCLGNNYGKVQPSCAANNALISQVPDEEIEKKPFKELVSTLEECTKDMYENTRIAANVKGLDEEDQEYLNEAQVTPVYTIVALWLTMVRLGEKLKYCKELQEEIKGALSTLAGGGGSEHSTMV